MFPNSLATIGKLIAKLPEHWSFHFVDGEHSCEAAAETRGLFPPPYLCYYQQPTLDLVKEAHLFLDDILQSGNFDILLGFSQGAALIASYLLHHQERHRTDTPPVKVAIFISASLPFSIDDSHGVTASENGFPKAAPEVYFENGAASKDWLRLMRRWTPRTDIGRLSIPTVHAYGKKDSYRSQSHALVDLCDASTSTTVEHHEGHCVPTSETTSQKLAGAIMSAAQ